MAGMNAYWQDGFVAARPALSAIGQLADQAFEFFRWSVYHSSGILGGTLLLPASGLALALAVAGCARFFRERNFRFAAYAISPLLILAGYSFAGLWPFGATRVNLFYAPLLIVAAAVGGAFLWERLWAAGRGPARFAAVLLAAACLAGFMPVRRMGEFFFGRNELKAPIERLLLHYRPGDAILTRDTTHRIVIYYTRLHAPGRKLGKTVDIHDVYHPWDGFMGRHRVPAEAIEADVREQFRTHQRIWLVFKWDFRAKEEEAAILRAARSSGRARWGIQKDFFKVLLFEPYPDSRP